jgi:hypothetical protein
MCLYKENTGSSQDWFVIDDGTDCPFIIHEESIQSCIDEILNLSRESCINELNNALAFGDKSLYVDVLQRELNNKERVYGEESLWIPVYHIEEGVIEKYNDYAEDNDLPALSFPLNEDSIREALFSHKTRDLMDFLRSEKTNVLSVYIPEKLLEFNDVSNLVAELI